MKKLKNIAIVLLVALMANFIPMTTANAVTSKFGIDGVGLYQDNDGNRKVMVAFKFDVIEKVKSVKVFTKVRDFNDSQNIVVGPTFNLTTKQSAVFFADLNESDIKSFGIYEVDKIEVLLNDGTKKVSFNNSFYKNLSENDKENGELVYYDIISHERQPLFIENASFEKKTVKLGEAQNFKFDIRSSKEAVKPSKVYVTFKNTTNESAGHQVVVAEKKEGLGYVASLTLINSLDTGNWTVDNIEVIDNYERSSKYEGYYDNYKVVSENTDITPPVLEDITLNDNTYDASKNNEVYFTLKVSDDISGINHAYVNLYNKETDSFRSVYAYSNSKDPNVLVAYIKGMDKNGVYDIKDVEISDKAGNYVRYVSPKYKENPGPDEILKSFDGLSVEIINVEEIEEPEIEILEIKNNSKEVSNGNKIDLNMKIKSNKKINYISIYYAGLDGESKEIYGNVAANYDENGNIIKNEDGIYDVKFNYQGETLEYLGSGEYIINSLSIRYFYDSNTIKAMYLYDDRSKWIPEGTKTYDFSELDFTCSNPNEDITPPEILDITVDKGVVTPGDTVEISVKAKDDNSGFKGEYSWLNPPSIYYYTSGSTMSVYFDKYDEESGVFKGTLKIPSYISTGVYTIGNMYVYDLARNSKYYYWDHIEDKPLLSKGTILVKKDINEKLPPVISTDIEEGKVYKAPFTPIVSSDHGTIKMLLNDKEYNGEPINKLGDYHLYITATGVDGSVSTQKVSFKVITEINNETKPEEIINQIIGSEEKVVSIEVKNESLEVDKSIFEAIKGLDKTVSFTQEDGTVWSFNGADIKDENLEGIGNIKISVKNVAEEENQEPINNIDAKAKVIHFDYHGVLPGKASVKVKVDNPQDVMGKDLTFYYFNPETQKPEKIQGPLSVDNDGFVTVEIEHCSDYFLSESDNLADAPEPINLNVNKTEVNLVEGSSEKLIVNVTPEGTEVQYSSSNEGIAKVSSTGVIEAVSKGEAVISVKAGDVTKEVKVVVKAKEVDEEKPTEPQVPETPEQPENPVEEPQTPEVPSETENSSNEDEANLPQTGGRVSMNNALIISIAIIALGVVLLKRRKIYNK
ncbi:Ig-like domain-containing protein [Clostridium intestinale]|uniref:LPXTG-motif cell wall anchor domain-containing protein n=1 Tax=Clostridium intestinale URNW TaxID=1294142 RepID=U2N9B5_9CLOT|nr:Ig-like domain-containing protein [Clostridium intestinale]ERK32082.1 LPXTG-motif cell wall anchor domain-containing protein [Clostridium intestinale URNW]